METVQTYLISHRGRWLSNRRLIHAFDILRVLVARDIKLRYKRAVMGIAWTLLNPLSELLVLLFIFKVVLPLNIPNYPSFLFTGILTYAWFQSSLVFAANAIVGNRDLIKQPGFPPTMLPVAAVASNLLHFLLALPILFTLLLVSGFRPSINLLGLPLLIAVQFALTLSLAYLVAALHVRFRDTQYLLKVGLQLLFYLSPVFYAATDVPEKYQWIYRLNPMVYLIDAYRAVLMRSEFPAYLPLLGLAILSAVLLWVGLSIFMRASNRFVEELG
jgi:lipopolysaccharide transport system permease protein